jgi:predicted DNA-binding antitoxin AbrB/MazE fold protein
VTTFEAIYEDGVLRPLQPVSFAEQQRVTLAIVEPVGVGDDGRRDIGYEQLLAEDAGEVPSLEAVRAALAAIPGSLTADFVAERRDR